MATRPDVLGWRVRRPGSAPPDTHATTCRQAAGSASRPAPLTTRYPPGTLVASRRDMPSHRRGRRPLAATRSEGWDAAHDLARFPVGTRRGESPQDAVTASVTSTDRGYSLQGDGSSPTTSRGCRRDTVRRVAAWCCDCVQEGDHSWPVAPDVAGLPWIRRPRPAQGVPGRHVTTGGQMAGDSRGQSPRHAVTPTGEATTRGHSLRRGGPGDANDRAPATTWPPRRRDSRGQSPRGAVTPTGEATTRGHSLRQVCPLAPWGGASPAATAVAMTSRTLRANLPQDVRSR
ncbi:hypothetical protein SAMN04489747_3432 [Auraticoccus monumenti]|uniref:Uncharacterized protein n=1 Tax=Auraticoccus monumenti TaxID=675864 RepID=A0A1G7CZE8_9ACTN|nr:hypothetical protein SAMN04489747_3432 [Auraticoccus monumenti]